MATLERDGVSLCYEIHGQGPAILLTHGYSADTTMWKPNVQALAESHTLILWDIRGHGRSDSPADDSLYSREHCMADMTALLDVAGVRQAVIGGLSLGGYLSLAFHAFHPERTSALLIFDTGPGYRNDAAREDWNRMAIRSGEAQPTDGLKRAARGILTQQDSKVLDSLAEIKVPALVLAGANDKPFLKATDYMAAKIPGASRVIIENAGHVANADQPDAFNSAVLGFLASHGL